VVFRFSQEECVPRLCFNFRRHKQGHYVLSVHFGPEVGFFSLSEPIDIIWPENQGYVAGKIQVGMEQAITRLSHKMTGYSNQILKLN
jgi:hypothetical protein